MKRLKAGSLTYAVFISVIAAIICLLMITLAFANRTFFIRSDVREKLKDNALSGVALAMALPPGEEHFDWHDLYQEGSDSVLIKKRPWGAYEMISAYAQTGNNSSSRSAIAGYSSSQSRETSLYLADRNRPLQLAGNALLKGKCWLPRKGLDKAYIEGTHYSREKMIYGQSNVSKSTIPPIVGGKEHMWKDYLEKKLTDQDSALDFGEISAELSHPFYRKTLVFFSDQAIGLSGLQLSGNIVVVSGKKIVVDKNNRLEDIVLVAPVIILEEELKAELQAIARDTLIVKSKTELRYPSSLLVLGGEKTYLSIESNTAISGCIISYAEARGRSLDLAIEIMPDAIVNGLVYCKGNLEHMGKVNGLVLGNAFLLKTPSGVYENHLLHGEIDRSELASEFCGPAVEDWNNQTRIVKWTL